jgi:plastocyanin
VARHGGLIVEVVDSLNDAGRSPSVALDKDGNPVVTYLLLKPVLKKGELPAPVLAGSAQPPSVMLASESKGIWTRTAVSGGGGLGKAVGKAPEIANKGFQAIPGVNVSLAVDGQGKHHVVWATPTGLFYSDDTSGSFAEPEVVAKTVSLGASVAAASDGTPWISVYTFDGLQVLHREGGKWVTETVDKSLTPPPPQPATTALRITAGGEPVVAYDGHGATTVARRAGGTWKIEGVPGPGGLGVSLALDKSDNPHVAYYDGDGNVRHAHSLGGGPWEVTDLGKTAPGATGPDAAWSTGIALDDKGTHYITWADTQSKQIMLATNAGGKFSARAVPESTGGANPSVAVSSDGKKVAVSWYDGVNGNLDVATTSTGLVLAFSPAPASPVQTTTATEQCSPTGTTTLDISAPSGASGTGFDKKCLAIKAGTAFTVDFKNDDITVHNWELFTDSSAIKTLGGAKGVTDGVSPNANASYKVSALQAGSYFFRCDFHPTTMTGTFVVAK